MPWPSAVEAAPMSRLAIVGPSDQLREHARRVGRGGRRWSWKRLPKADSGDASEALRRLRASRDRRATTASPCGHALRPVHRARGSAPGGPARGRGRARTPGGGRRQTRAFVVAVGWCPDGGDLDNLSGRLETLGGGVVVLPRRPFAEPPTLLRTPPGGSRPFSPLVEIYGTARYRRHRPDALSRRSRSC